MPFGIEGLAGRVDDLDAALVEGAVKLLQRRLLPSSSDACEALCRR